MSQRKMLEFESGHWTKAERERKKAAEQSISHIGSDLLAKPPRVLIDAVARKKWKEVVPQLVELDLVSNLDIYNLIGFCNAYSNYERATKELSQSDMMIDTRTGLKLNPLVNAVGKFSEEMRRYESLIGLTTDSRLRIATKKVESSESSVKRMFGDI